MSQITFILVSPKRGENVGAAARAMKTMGFSRLKIVASDAHKSDQASWVAHGSQDILAVVEHFDSLAEALADEELIIATTARRRGDKRRPLTPSDAVTKVEALGSSAGRIALVFGPEASGLSKIELAQADLITSIPLAEDYPSLNLAQAIMLYAYEFSKIETASLTNADQAQFYALKQRSVKLLDKLGVEQNEPLRLWAQDALGNLSSRDVAMMHLLIGDVEKALQR